MEFSPRVKQSFIVNREHFKVLFTQHKLVVNTASQGSTWVKSNPPPDRLRAVPENFPLEFVEPRKDIANTGARKPRRGESREATKIGTTGNLLFEVKQQELSR